MDSTQDTQEEWEHTLIDTSKKLMDITHEHYTRLLATLNEKIPKLEQLLDHIQLADKPQLSTEQQQ